MVLYIDSYALMEWIGLSVLKTGVTRGTIDTALIERIRKALIKRYDRDQQIQQMIEEIGAEEGLNETELAIVYQAYLGLRERIYYTSSLVDL